MPKKPRRASASSAALRFAHPFYTTQAPDKRKPHPGGFGTRLLDHIQKNVQRVPAPKGDSTMSLSDIIGPDSVQAIAATGTMTFHAVGDTGRRADSPQGQVASAMAQDYDVVHPERSPAFFFHLGDVIYGNDKDQRYRREFYEPYVHYPGKIIAIAGNHDGEVFPNTDPVSLRAFLANFCAPRQAVPAIAGTIFRQTLNQPGVYWLLDAPFVQIVGLYSNVAENPGFISGTIPGEAQKNWLIKTLKGIAKDRSAGKRKGLVLATHHPPYTSGGHSPSKEMLADVDDACTKGGVMPDLFLSAHAHSYQRYSRTIRFAGRSMEIPFIVAGCGGISDQAVPPATGQKVDDHVFENSRKGYGYLQVTASAASLTAKLVAVDGEARSDYDTVTVDLATNTVR
ncbi:MAG: metallophosphoesterase [Gemmatimonadetes bacterium]|nr:MAG: metallophosphoesterase [Gemmatimonadota bacterium]